MKKLLSSVLSLLTLSLCVLTAHADILVDPKPEPSGSPLPIILIVAAVVIAAAVILALVLKKKK